MKFTPADCGPHRAKRGDPGATSAVRHQGEARIAQERAMLSQKPGTATATEGGATAVASSSSPLWPCLCGARNRLRDTACRHCGADKP